MDSVDLKNLQRVAARIVYLPLILCSLILSISEPADAQQAAALYSKEGSVQAQAPGGAWTESEIGATYNENDTIKTGAKSRAGVKFVDGVLVRLNENSLLEFKKADAGNSRPINMQSGMGYFFSREPKKFPTITTPTVSASVRGTEFAIEVQPERTVVAVLNGEVECANEFGSVRLGKGEQAVTQKGQAPVKSILVKPLDAVQWALYYPAVLDYQDFGDFEDGATDAQKRGWSSLRRGSMDEAADGFRGSTWRDAMGRSLVAYKRGDLAAAFRELNDIKDQPSAGFFLYRAGLNLSAGQVSSASSDLDSAERGIANLSGAAADRIRSGILSVRSVISLTSADKAKARSQSEEALRLNPESTSAALSMSYVRQSYFELGEARAELEKALERDPDNAFLLARLAELDLGFGNHKQAVRRAARAVELAPEQAYPRTVLAFTELIRGESEDARGSFERALDLDPSSGLAHLGMGLATIREGELEEGRAHIEQAVHLEPSVSLYRSYLGKAFFEENRGKMANQEFEQAMSLDPLDPTPHYYRSFNYLQNNQPVEALWDIEESIRLNDNRAVFRSSLLLDQDVASRSAGLAETFNTLGFNEIARLEAVNAINRDYSNYSAHKLLSESYDTLFENDAALSERRIANLLAPLSFNLFSQPSAEASINEYNSLFDRDQSRTILGLTYNTYEDQVGPAVGNAGKFDDFGYFVGYDSNFMNGSKDNEYFHLHRGTVLTQYQPNFDDRFSFGWNGGVARDESPLAELDDNRQEFYNFDVGYNHRFMAGTHLLVQGLYSRNRNDFKNFTTDRPILINEISGGETLQSSDDLLIDELSRERLDVAQIATQVIHDNEYVSTVTGAQFTHSDVEREEKSEVITDLQGLFDDLDYVLRSAGYVDVNAFDAYKYATIHLGDFADFTAGLTYTQLDLPDTELPPFASDSFGKSRLNPKAGVSLYPHETTTVRFAYFENLRKTTFSDNSSIEPSLVAGVNQLYTELPGTETRNYAGGVDFKSGSGTYLGLQALHRDVLQEGSGALQSVTLDYDNGVVTTNSALDPAGEVFSEQNIHNAYFYQVLSKRTVFSLDYAYAEFRQTVEEGKEDQLHRTIAGLRYFLPGGFFFFSQAAWREQDSKNSVFVEDGNRDFWVVDTGVGYRLPRRHGSVVLQFNNILDQNFTYDQFEGYETLVRPEFNVNLMANINF